MATIGGEPSEQLGRRLVAVAVVAPVGAVADDEHAPVAGVGAAGRTVGHAIDKEGGVAGTEGDFYGGGHFI